VEEVTKPHRPGSSPTVATKDYEDFVLRILRRDLAGYVAIPTGPAEVATGPGEPFASPFGGDELEELRVLRGCGSRDLDPQKKTVRSTRLELGQRLFEKVFSGKIRRLWDKSLEGSQKDGRRLRLRLVLESPELWDWPWEYLRDPDAADFLVLSPDISIVRSPEVPRPVPALRARLPLRILVVIAQPSGSAELDSAREWQELKRSLEDLEAAGDVELSRVDSVSLATLRSDLEKPIHVLHFIGHGGFDQDREQAFLEFETRNGEPHRVTGADLARLLRR
jgi:hypothetical protein